MFLWKKVPLAEAKKKKEFRFDTVGRSQIFATCYFSKGVFFRQVRSFFQLFPQKSMAGSQQRKFGSLQQNLQVDRSADQTCLLVSQSKEPWSPSNTLVSSLVFPTDEQLKVISFFLFEIVQQLYWQFCLIEF